MRSNEPDQGKSNPQIQIHPLTVDHITRGFSCGVESLDHTLHSLRVARPRPDRIVLIATWPSDRNVLGFVAVEKCELRLDTQEPQTILYIPWLAVDQKYQRRGIGTHLLIHGLTRAKQWIPTGRCAAALHCEPSNYSYYSALGFHQLDAGLFVLPPDLLDSL